MVKVKKGQQFVDRQLTSVEIEKRLFTIGRVLKAAREERTNLDKFAYEINISRTSMVKYEAGGNMLLSTFLKVLHGLDISTAEFFKQLKNKAK